MRKYLGITRKRVKLNLRKHVGELRDNDHQLAHIRNLLDQFELHVGDGATMEREADRKMREEYYTYTGVVTERALCAYIRHHHSNYDRIMREVNYMGTPQPICDAVRYLISAEIIGCYSLRVSVLDAAFGDEIQTTFDDEKTAHEHALELLGVDING